MLIISDPDSNEYFRFPFNHNIFPVLNTFLHIVRSFAGYDQTAVKLRLLKIIQYLAPTLLKRHVQTPTRQLILIQHHPSLQTAFSYPLPRCDNYPWILFHNGETECQVKITFYVLLALMFSVAKYHIDNNIDSSTYILWLLQLKRKLELNVV